MTYWTREKMDNGEKVTFHFEIQNNSIFPMNGENIWLGDSSGSYFGMGIGYTHKSPDDATLEEKSLYLEELMQMRRITETEAHEKFGEEMA